MTSSPARIAAVAHASSGTADWRSTGVVVRAVREEAVVGTGGVGIPTCGDAVAVGVVGVRLVGGRAGTVSAGQLPAGVVVVSGVFGRMHRVEKGSRKPASCSRMQ